MIYLEKYYYGYKKSVVPQLYIYVYKKLNVVFVFIPNIYSSIDNLYRNSTIFSDINIITITLNIFILIKVKYNVFNLIHLLM